MKLLLHICCAPCSIMCIKSLREENIEPVGFWYNPNIHPYTEYRMRKTTLEDYAKQINLKLIIGGKYGLRPFLTQVGSDFDNRCVQCYRMRMFETARYAAENGFTHFTSTLFISPYQRHELMAEIAKEAAAHYGITFLYRDFRPYFKEGQECARALGLYMQKYCGCIFSEEDRYQKRKKSEKNSGDLSLAANNWKQLLTTKVLGRGRIMIEESMDSTNRVLKQMALDGAPAGSVVLCHHQTAGRGRMDRKWIASAGEALTMSVLIDLDKNNQRAPLLTLCASMAVIRALKNLCPDVKADIKWPNDVIVDGKKLCGILCEAVSGNDGAVRVICGIGLNVLQSAFPDDLKERATSLFMIMNGEKVPQRGELAAEILNELEKTVDVLSEKGEGELLRQYVPDCATLGHEVRVLSLTGEWLGRAVDIAEDGTLLVLREDGAMVNVSCGDVSIREIADYCG